MSVGEEEMYSYGCPISPSYFNDYATQEWRANTEEKPT